MTGGTKIDFHNFIFTKRVVLVLVLFALDNKTMASIQINTAVAQNRISFHAHVSSVT